MKKAIAIGLTTLLASATLLSACGSSNNNNDAQASAGSSAASAAAPVKLRFWGAVPPESGPQTVVDKWNQAHPDIQVEYVRFVNDDPGNTKLETALLSTNDAPDIYMTYSDSFMSRRISAGMAEPLDELAAQAGLNIDEVIGSDNIMKSNGHTYYLPAAKNYQLVMINESALDAAGEKVPTDWTWDDYAELAKKLTKPGQYGSFINPTWEPIAYDAAISSKPVDVYYGDDGLSTFASLPAFKRGLEVQKSIIDAKATYPYAESVTNKLQPQDELLTGKSAMVYTGTYLIRYIKDEQAYPNRDFKIAFAPMPQFEKGTNVNSSGMGDYLSINPQSKYKEASMQFIDWYLTEGDNDMIPGGRIPSNKKANMDQIADQLIGESGKYFDKDSLVNLLKADVTFKSFTQTTAQPDIRKAFMEEAEKYFMNAQTVDQAIENMKTRSDKAIQQAK